MSEKVRYVILKAPSDTDLTLEVIELMNRGFSLAGGLQIGKVNSQPMFYQAMFKRTKDEKPR